MGSDCFTQVQMEDAFKIVENSNIGISRHLDTSTNGLDHGPIWKIQSFFLSEVRTVILSEDYSGKSNSRKLY